MRFYLKLIMVLAVLGMTAVLPAQAQFNFMQHPLVGQKAPGFDLYDLAGQAVNFSKVSLGKDTIVFFWATWCPHCREQLKVLGRNTEQMKKEGVSLILVDLSEDPGTVKAYLDRNKLSFPVLLDGGGEVAEAYQVVGIPTFVFIDKSGSVQGVENFLPESYARYFKSGTAK